jgi:hypothetical protein
MSRIQIIKTRKFGILNFGFVSDFDIRISDLISSTMGISFLEVLKEKRIIL